MSKINSLKVTFNPTGF